MKKAYGMSLLTISLAFLVPSMLLLLTPVTAYAAECSANCGATTVTCYGYSCTSQDGVGCSAHNSKGVEVMRFTCTSE